MRKFTQFMIALALTFVGVGGANAQEEVDIPLDEATWTWGWNSTVSVTDGVMTIELTNNYGGGSIGWDPVQDWSSYAKVCAVIDSYTGGWGQMVLTFSDDTEVTQTYGSISAPTTITIDIENNAKASGVKKIALQGGTENPTITVSRVYLVKKLEYEDPEDVAFSSNFVEYDDIASYSNSAKLEFTIDIDIVNGMNYNGWGIGQIQSANGTLAPYGFAQKNVGENVYTCTIKDLREAIEAPAATEGDFIGKQGLFWNIWGQGTSDGNTFTLTSVKVYEVKNLCNVTVGDAGYTTFSYNKPIGLGAIDAYTAKYHNGYVRLTKVTAVPANTGVIIEAAAGTYKIPTLESAEAPADNDLLVSDGTVTGNGNIYVLANGEEGIGFYKLKVGDKVPSGKAYLEITATSRSFFGLGDDDTTGISEVGKTKDIKDNVYYNIAGQRVAQPKKGLYIVNGKKVIIK